MPLICVELDDSRTSTVALDATNSAIEGHWVVLGVGSGGAWDTTAGTMDDSLIRANVDAYLPLTYLGLWFIDYRLEHRGNKVWDVRARYGTRPPRRPDGISGVSGWDTPTISGLVPSYTIDITAATEHVLRSKETVGEYRRTGAPAIPDFERQVGVNGDSIEGVDIYTRKFEFTETHYFTDLQMTPEFRRILFLLTTKTNNATFRGFSRGEVLFLGATLSKKGTENWEAVFKFAASPNRTDLETEIQNMVAPGGIPKKGWEYLWIRYVPLQNSKSLIQVPQYVKIERMYDEGDFSTLQIGVF